VRCRRKKFTFAISSPDEFLSVQGDSDAYSFHLSSFYFYFLTPGIFTGGKNNNNKYNN